MATCHLNCLSSVGTTSMQQYKRDMVIVLLSLSMHYPDSFVTRFALSKYCHLFKLTVSPIVDVAQKLRSLGHCYGSHEVCAYSHK